MQVIIYTNENGNVSVCYPSGELPIQDVLIKDCPVGSIIVENSELPSEYDEFFNAWRLSNGKVYVDFDASKDITKDRLRTERKPMLESLDVVQLRNLNNPEVLATIEAKKQALRDATNQVDTMTTLDELKAASLPVLE
jgi:hypothetical protein